MNDKFLDAMIEQSIQMMTDACHGKSLSKDEMAFIIATHSTIVRVLNSCACIDNTANLTVVNTGLEANYSDAEITIVRLN